MKRKGIILFLLVVLMGAGTEDARYNKRANFAFILVIWALFLCHSVSAQKKHMPLPIGESYKEPVKYTGELQPDKRFYDGRLPYVVGVHHHQAFRANRTNPSEPGPVGWTYNHQPYLAYWNDTFYLQYLAGLIQEHDPPTRTLVMTSKDGMNWTAPVVVFPKYALPKIEYKGESIPKGTKAVMHQRMGFYVAPNGKLLTSGFYGFAATPRRSPNAGNGLGRVVREIHKDGSLGPIYFIRYNRHAGWNESNTEYPFYKTSSDKEFIEACEALLADKLITLQWWEEDRAKDGFYTADPSKVPGGDDFSHRIVTASGAGKAFNFYHRPDGVVVGLWKNQYAALSPDNGLHWRPVARNKTLLTTGAKTWGQRTADGKYVIVHNQSPTRRNRFPMTVLTGNDGHIFDRIFTMNGEVPSARYQGLHKSPGLQYFRGIIEGNGNPPDDHLWLTYSINKEDIWVTRSRVPITDSVNDEVNQNFEGIDSIQDLEMWNIYMPTWAPILIKKDPATDKKYLQLRDEEPYNYASVTRIFPESFQKRIEFRFQGERLPQGYAAEAEVQDQRGNRALKLRIDHEWLSFDIGSVELDPVRIHPQNWNKVVLDIDVRDKSYTAMINGEQYPEKIPLNKQFFDEYLETVERIVFRTGPYRNYVPAEMVNGIAEQPGFYSEDLPGSDKKAPLIVFNIDDVITQSN